MLSYFLFILQAQFKHYYKKKKKDPHRQRQGQGHVRIKSGWDEKQATEKPAETCFRLSMPQKLMISKTACQWFLSGRHSIYKWNIFLLWGNRTESYTDSSVIQIEIAGWVPQNQAWFYSVFQFKTAYDS